MCVYMDHAATTPMAPEVWEAMKPFASEVFGNASSLHSFGREARNALERAREQVAGLIGAPADQVIFTSGGTESDNMALCGVALARRDTHRHIVTTAIEHHAVLETCRFLDQVGFEATYLTVDSDGFVEPQQVADALRPDTALVSIMTANNEIGTIQPIAAISEVTKEKGVLFHTDAVQACGAIPIDVAELGVDLLSMSGHKLYGPKGIGALFYKKEVPLERFHHGGEQERKRRGGTENVQSAAGMGRACELAVENLEQNVPRLEKLRDRLIEGVLNGIEGVRLNGHRTQRLPGNANFSFEGADSQSLLVNLDLAGIAASNGSACASGSPQPSHVLPAIGLESDLARCAIRFSLGRSNTESEVDYVIEQLNQSVDRIRSAAGG